MNDEQQRARYNRSTMQSNEDWYLRTPEDEEERYVARQQRENDKVDKEEYLAECARDCALTNPKEEVKVEQDYRRPLTEKEKEDIAFRNFDDHGWRKYYGGAQ